MEILDAQLHDFGPSLDWSGADTATRNALRTELVLAWMDAVGVDSAVLIPTDWDWGAQVAREQSDRIACVYSIHNPDDLGVPKRLAHLYSTSAIVGARASFGRIPQDPDGSAGVSRLRDGVYEPSFEACEKFGIPFFCSAYGHVRLVGEIAQRYPDLQLIVDHLGIPQPPLNPRVAPVWGALDDLLALSDRPNIAVKMSGVPVLSDGEFPYRDVWPHLHRLFGAFGLERIMWGSDIGRFWGRIAWENRWPEAKGPFVGKHTYAEALMFVRETDQITQEEKALLLGTTARRILKWNRPTPSESVAAPSTRSQLLE